VDAAPFRQACCPCLSSNFQLSSSTIFHHGEASHGPWAVSAYDVIKPWFYMLYKIPIRCKRCMMCHVMYICCNVTTVVSPI
jgi:hypothetical protein